MKTIRFTKIFLFIIITSIFALKAQSKQDYIYLSGTKFTYPLIEKWISEYTKINPGIRIKIQYNKQDNDSVNLRIVAHTLAPDEIKQDEVYLKVSKYALLPIVNERNYALKKEFKKGLNQDEFKNVFFENPNILLEADTQKTPAYTVYTRANRSCSSVAFANHFGLKPNEIKGKKISGDDQYLTAAILKDTTGITYNSLGNIFDVKSRVPLKGLSILPIDINGNGKIDKEEQIYDNLDNLTQYLENNQDEKAIPTDFVHFIVNKDHKSEALRDFIWWVVNDGQKFNHAYGFLNTNNLDKTLSQNLIWKSDKK